MEFWLGVGGFFAIVDAFDAKNFGLRQEWEVGLGAFLLLLAALVAIFGDDE